MPRIKTKPKRKWFESGKSLNWKASENQKQRRRSALKSRKGKLLPTARALMALANVTTDKTTEKKARADALYFFALYKNQQTREN